MLNPQEVQSGMKWSWEPSWEPFPVNTRGRPLTPTDSESRPYQPVWTPLDGRGHGLEIYGSEGWGFESLRACRQNW
jgi:hypothetical protein